ncbi:MAG TPA: hypothetical protein VE986_02995 [Hyphomicrobiales bacterium]|nr:hypothetical protein [Hyphomicrobiales bacterium]
MVFQLDQWRSEVEPDPAAVAKFLQFAPILVFLLFMGLATIVNAITGRWTLNGALLYLLVAAAVFALGAWKIFSNPETTAGDKAELLGRLTGLFIIPVGLAIFFSLRFRKKCAKA